VSFIIYVKDSVCQDSGDAVEKKIQDSVQIKGMLVLRGGGVCGVFVHVGFFVHGSNGRCVIVGRGARLVAGLFCWWEWGCKGLMGQVGFVGGVSVRSGAAFVL
jgi:hypothetical protein